MHDPDKSHYQMLNLRRKISLLVPGTIVHVNAHLLTRERKGRIMRVDYGSDKPYDVEIDGRRYQLDVSDIDPLEVTEVAFDLSQKRLALHPIRFHDCPDGHTHAFLLVDIETNAEATMDVNGCYQYYCPICNVVFVVDEQGAFIDPDCQEEEDGR